MSKLTYTVADLLLPLGVFFLQLLEDVDLELGGLPVLVHVLDDLEGQHLVRVQLLHLDHLAEGSLAQGGQNFI